MVSLYTTGFFILAERSGCPSLICADVIKQANDTTYGLAAAVFSQDINRALRTAHKMKAGTAWVGGTCLHTSRR